MVRQLLLPLLGLGLLFTVETASAQAQVANSKSPASAAKTARQTRRAARVLATPGPEARPSGSGAAVVKP